MNDFVKLSNQKRFQNVQMKMFSDRKNTRPKTF